MATGKKYNYRVVQHESTWTAEITRRMTAKETIVSKSQPGFATAEEAEAWGQKELEQFTKALSERNKRRAR